MILSEKTNKKVAAAIAEREERLERNLKKYADDLKMFNSIQVDLLKDDLYTLIAKLYFKTGRADVVAAWALDTIPGFAYSKHEALKKINKILDDFQEDEEGIFGKAAWLRKHCR